MLINWLTVSAQLFNFLLLVWLLNKFLFKPVLVAIEIRDKKLASKWQDAEQEKQKAQELGTALQKEKDELANKKASLFSELTEEGNAERKKRMDAIRLEATDLRARLKESIQKEEQELHDAIVQKVEQEVFLTSKKVLHDLANASIETSMIDQFIHRLSSLNTSDKTALISACTSQEFPTKIITCFQLLPQERTKVEKALQDVLGMDIQVTYETSKEGICGIELITNKYKVRWRILDYLEEIG